MPRVQQTFANVKDTPIYISVEMRPDCFELEPGDKLTLIWDGPETGDISQVNFVNERELVIWPEGPGWAEVEYLINGAPAADRSWDFKHPFLDPSPGSSTRTRIFDVRAALRKSIGVIRRAFGWTVRAYRGY